MSKLICRQHVVLTLKLYLPEFEMWPLPCRLCTTCLSATSGTLCGLRAAATSPAALHALLPPQRISRKTSQRLWLLQLHPTYHTAGNWGRGRNPWALPLHSYLGSSIVTEVGRKKAALLVLVLMQTKQALAPFLFAVDWQISPSPGFTVKNKQIPTMYLLPHPPAISFGS